MRKIEGLITRMLSSSAQAWWVKGIVIAPYMIGFVVNRFKKSIS